MISAKFVAVLLGAEGIGIMGLLTSPIGIITTITSLGIGSAAVRDAAAAYGTGDSTLFSRVVTIMRRWVWFTGSFGAVTVILLSPLLSKWSFGNYDYTLWYILISCTLLFGQINAGQTVVLRAARRLKDIANSAITGSIIGLFIGIPMYYLWGLNGIVPAMIVGSVASLFRSWYFSRRVPIQKLHLSTKDIYHGGLDMVKLGIVMTLTGLLGALTAYLLKIYISDRGGVVDVGLFAAGFAVSNTYVNLVFTAMSTDYYPRLSAVHNDDKKVNALVNQQAEMGVLIISPLLMSLLSFVPLVLIILYSAKFLPIITMMQWIVFGLFLKVASWPIAYIILAKGDRKFFVRTEMIAQVYFFIFNILGYAVWGLEGLGVAFFLSYLCYFIQEFLIIRHKYKFTFSAEFYRVFIPQFILALILFLNVRFMTGWIMYATDAILVSISVYISLKHINKRTDIMTFVRTKISDILRKK